MKFILSLVLYCLSTLAMKKLAVEQTNFETDFTPQHLVMFHVKETPNAVYGFKDQVYVHDLAANTRRKIFLNKKISLLNDIRLVDQCILVLCTVLEKDEKDEEDEEDEKDDKIFYIGLIPIPDFILSEWMHFKGTPGTQHFGHFNHTYWAWRSKEKPWYVNVSSKKGLIGSVDSVDGNTSAVELVSHENNILLVQTCAEKDNTRDTLIEGFKFNLAQGNTEGQQKRLFVIDIDDRPLSIKPFHLSGNIIVNCVKLTRNKKFYYKFMVHEYREDGGIPKLINSVELTCGSESKWILSAVSDGRYVFMVTNEMKLICSGSNEPIALDGLHVLRITATGEIWCVEIPRKVGWFEGQKDLELNKYPLVCKGGDLVLGWPNSRTLDTITIKGVKDESKWTLVSKPNVTSRSTYPAPKPWRRFFKWLHRLF